MLTGLFFLYNMRQWNFISILKYIFACLSVGFIAFQLGFILQILVLIKFKPISTSFMTNEYNRLCFLRTKCEFKHQWISYDQIGLPIKKAVIASEDSNFIDHKGIEVDSIEKAWEKNLKKGKIIAGGSTISQQLAKNLFLSSEKNYLRKSQELLLTLYLETILDKRRILEIYLNSVEWGEGVFGIQAASEYYFHKNANEISNFQAASLASALPAPKCYDDDIYCNNVRINFKKRAYTIAKRMGLAGIPSDDNIQEYINKYSKKSKNAKK